MKVKQLQWRKPGDYEYGDLAADGLIHTYMIRQYPNPCSDLPKEEWGKWVAELNVCSEDNYYNPVIALRDTKEEIKKACQDHIEKAIMEWILES